MLFGHLKCFLAVAVVIAVCSFFELGNVAPLVAAQDDMDAGLESNAINADILSGVQKPSSSLPTISTSIEVVQVKDGNCDPFKFCYIVFSAGEGSWQGQDCVHHYGHRVPRRHDYEVDSALKCHLECEEHAGCTAFTFSDALVPYDLGHMCLLWMEPVESCTSWINAGVNYTTYILAKTSVGVHSDGFSRVGYSEPIGPARRTNRLDGWSPFITAADDLPSVEEPGAAAEAHASTEDEENAGVPVEPEADHAPYLPYVPRQRRSRYAAEEELVIHGLRQPKRHPQLVEQEVPHHEPSGATTAPPVPDANPQAENLQGAATVAADGIQANAESVESGPADAEEPIEDISSGGDSHTEGVAAAQEEEEVIPMPLPTESDGEYQDDNVVLSTPLPDEELNLDL